MEKKLKVGFIGGSINSAVGYTHKIACQMDEKWELVSGCFSTNEKVNYDTAEVYGIKREKIYNNWKAFLDNERKEIDAICILTPTDTHYEIIMYALKLGYAIICEKAMVSDYSDAVKICNYVKKNNNFLVVTYNYTGYPMLRELKEWILNGKLGTITKIIIEMPQEGFAKLSSDEEPIIPQKWRLKDDIIHTLSLDLGVHLQNIIYFLTGEKPIRLVADGATDGNFDTVVDDVMCIAEYTNGLRSQIWYSKSAIGNRNGLRIRVYGKSGSAEWFQMEPEKFIYSDVFGNQRIIDRSVKNYVGNALRYNRFKAGHPAGFIEAFSNYYYDIAECLNQYINLGKYKSEFIFDSFDAKEGLKMLDAISKSIVEKRWVEV